MHAPSPAYLARLAVQSAVLEASLTPKPGLVCPDTQGAHKDMDITTMTAGALSLQSYFVSAAEYGSSSANLQPEDVFPKLRELGVTAEQNMLAATGGINTHKGLIFSLGLIVAATARNAAHGQPILSEKICKTASSFIQGIVNRDFAALAPFKTQAPAASGVEQAQQALQRKLTAGEKLYLAYGITGIRGEAEQGFPNLLAAREFFTTEFARGGFSEAATNTLLFLIKETQDTNVLHRGGKDGLEILREKAAQTLAAGGISSDAGKRMICTMQEICLSRNLSPGGCADLLACVMYFHLLDTSPLRRDSM